MEFVIFVLLLQLCAKLLPLFFMIAHAWSFCYLLMFIDVLLPVEEVGLHSLATGCIKSTILLYIVPSKDYQQPPETTKDNRISTHQDTVACDGGLQHPEECSSDNEDSMSSSSVEWKLCSEVELAQELVLTVPRLPQQLNTELNTQLMPSVVTLEQKNTQVSPLIVRQVLPATDISPTTMQELQPDDARYPYGYNGSTPEDEDDRRSVTVNDESYSCGNCEVEQMTLQGAVLRQSSEPDTKSDQEGKNEVMPMVKVGCTVIESDSSVSI